MKKKFKSAVKCLLMSTCLAGVGAFIFASMGYADTTEWQELRSIDESSGYGVYWRTIDHKGNPLSNWDHDELYVGQTVEFSFNMHSENVGNHYAHTLKAWFAPNGVNFDQTNTVASGFKKLRANEGDKVLYHVGNDSSDLTYDIDYSYNDYKLKVLNSDRKEYKKYRDGPHNYGNDNYTVLSDAIEITSEYVGTAYLRARVTSTDSIGDTAKSSLAEWSTWHGWSDQWEYTEAQYLAAFDAYSYYGQGEIETWAMTVKSDLSGGGVNPVPEPATLALFGMGLIGLARVGRKKA